RPPAGGRPGEPVGPGAGDEATVTYPAVWPGVDVVYSVSSVRVKEKIVVSDAATATFPFVAARPGPTAGAAAKPGAVAAPAPKVTGAQAGTVSFDPLTASDESGRPDAKARPTTR